MVGLRFLPVFLDFHDKYKQQLLLNSGLFLIKRTIVTVKYNYELEYL